jgi:hypothetical protein
MTILDEHRAEITRRVLLLAFESQFSLRTLFGGRDAFREYIPRSGIRKALGTQFRNAVEANQFPMIAYSHHSDSPSEHWYMRIN